MMNEMMNFRVLGLLLVANKCFIWQLQMDGRHFYDPKTQGFWVVEMGFWVVEKDNFSTTQNQE